jgi:hypothetical protein
MFSSQPCELITVLNSILSSYDPDVIHTHFGDAWLLPHLLELSARTGIHLNLNRDSSVPAVRRKETSFFNYGHAHYRSAQIHLRGRWHVDVQNCMTYNQYQLGSIEQTRFSSLPLQEVAGVLRALRSLRANFTAMKMHAGTLSAPEGELAKNFENIFRRGLVFQPTPAFSRMWLFWTSVPRWHPL